MILFSAAAHAESVYQLQAGLSSGLVIVNGGAGTVTPSVSIGIEDGASVWLLQLGGHVGHGEWLIGSQNGTTGCQTVTTTGVGGEARLGDHFAIDARVYASLNGLRESATVIWRF